MEDLSIIQATYDLIVWFVPLLNRLPRDHKFLLGDRIATGLYDVLECLIDAQYAGIKVAKLQALNPKLSILRRQTRLPLDFGLIEKKRSEYATVFSEMVWESPSSRAAPLFLQGSHNGWRM